MALRLFSGKNLSEVFIPGGQPSVTYVERTQLGIEREIKKAIALPNSFVSVTGPTKSGKTVLCRNVLAESQSVWIDGGQIKTEAELWGKVCAELRLAAEQTQKTTSSDQSGGGAGINASVGVSGTSAGVSITASGSRVTSTEITDKFALDGMSSAIDAMLDKGVVLAIDDFHYIPDVVRTGIIHSLKGPVFRGLKVILLSTPHRAFAAIKAESEITGRFKHVGVPSWSEEDLKKIAEIGFRTLNVDIDSADIDKFAQESLGSPLLMQRFCWEVCYGADIHETATLTKIIGNIDFLKLFGEVAQDAGEPVYAKLAKGPQSRTERIPRPLVGGGSADIYEAILLAVAVTGPKEKLTYDQIRASLNNVLADKIPQKLEVSNALNNLSNIDADQNKGQRAIDWDGENLDLFITDPFFRFYLKWKISNSFEGRQ